jgi:hypothetical protein
MVARFPSFGGIKAFYALVETCRLAWGLCFSLGHQIKKLEQELNIRLLESNAGKLRPTDAGFRYFLGAERLSKRLIGSIRRECLDHVIVLGHICAEF